VPQRSIGQERLGFAPTSRSSSTLERLSELINWTPVSCLLEPLYPASKGEPAWPPLAMFKALLLAVWHDLSPRQSSRGSSVVSAFLWLFEQRATRER